MQRNPVEPRAQTGLAVKAADIAEDFNENLLRNIGGIGRVLQTARNQRIERLVILRDELGEGRFGSGSQLCNESSLFARQINHARQITHCAARLHPGCP